MYRSYGQFCEEKRVGFAVCAKFGSFFFRLCIRIGDAHLRIGTYGQIKWLNGSWSGATYFRIHFVSHVLCCVNIAQFLGDLLQQHSVHMLLN